MDRAELSVNNSGLSVAKQDTINATSIAIDHEDVTEEDLVEIRRIETQIADLKKEIAFKLNHIAEIRRT